MKNDLACMWTYSFFAFAVYLLQQNSYSSMSEQALLCCKSLKSCLSRTDAEPLRVHSSCVTVVELSVPAVTAQGPPQTVAEHSGFEGPLPPWGCWKGDPRVVDQSLNLLESRVDSRMGRMLSRMGVPGR